jgi:hypothetical protein
MTTPEQYANSALVGWMEKNAPDVLAVIRSNDMGATTAAVLGWMAENRKGDLRLIQTMEQECAECANSQEDLDCIGALIDAIEAELGPMLEMSRLSRPATRQARSSG